ncbi:pyridoxamine 5'-phosphate oxidase family protein [Orrella marina]|uniref:Phosphohydrolase n=1 Tax=Orrella marina TaxID=2163011 RepID=A0A2R4XKU8_9BURK|nr:pyridoxamine 5'-phosphate oxidase family protein [Orrella marina]AWB34425.1 phosphohydrolase [Orrella marina]
MQIQTLEALRSLYPEPRERALRKQLDHLDTHCRRFIETSPFLILSTSGQTGLQDASPRGGQPGFVCIRDDKTLLIPDSPGNNRLDSLQNIVQTGRAGLLFLIPGVDETLRVNGLASLSNDDDDLAACLQDGRREPRCVIRITVEEAYLHCPKALMRSRLWDPDVRIARETFPTLNEMIHAQTGDTSPVESQQDMLRRYQSDL